MPSFASASSARALSPLSPAVRSPRPPAPSPAPTDASDDESDALALWVEQASGHAARCASLRQTLASSRDAALASVAHLPPFPNAAPAAGQALVVAGGGEIAPTAMRAEVRRLRKRAREAIAVDEEARRGVAVRECRERVERERMEEARRTAEEREMAEKREREEKARVERERVEAERRRLEAEEREKRGEEARRAEDEAKAKAKAEDEAKAKAEGEAKAKAAAASADGGLPEHLKEAEKAWHWVCSGAGDWEKSQRADIKAMRLNVKKAVNRAVNQIAGSVKSVCGSAGKIVALLNDATKNNPPAVPYAMKKIAERLVAEGQISIAASTSGAFPVGVVVASVVAHAPDVQMMKNVILAAFVVQCPYVIPIDSRRIAGKTEQEFRDRLCYLKDEKEGEYVERMCGYISCYAAVLQTTEVYSATGRSQLENPFKLQEAGQWLARVIERPEPSITPDIVVAFLSIAGYELARYFKTEFGPFLDNIQRNCVAGAGKSTRPGPLSRLAVFVDEYKRAGGRVPKMPVGKALPVRDFENNFPNANNF